MDSLQPAFLSAVVLCLGGAGLLVSREGAGPSERSTFWVAFVGWSMSLAVFLLANAIGGGTHTEDDLLQSADDRITSLAAILLFLLSGCELILPRSNPESQRPAAVGFLLLGTSSGLLAAASNSLLLTVLFSELALAAWLWRQGRWSRADDLARKRRIRDLLSAVLLLVATILLTISAGADRFDAIASLLSSRLERAISNPSEGTTSIGLVVGLVGFVTAAAWRLSFFPFSPLPHPGEQEADIRPFATSLLTMLLLMRITPALRGLEESTQVLLCTFGGATFVSRLISLGRADGWSKLLDHSLGLTLASLWVTLSGQLFAQQYALRAADALFPSPEWLRGWGLGIGAWLLLGTLSRISEQAGHPLRRREDFAGWALGHPVFAGLCALTWLGWLSALGLPWPTLQRGMLAPLFRLAGSGFHAGEGYVVLGLAALIGLGWWMAVVLRWLTPIFAGTALRRGDTRIPLVSLAVLLAIASLLVWLARSTSGESLPVANKLEENLPTR